MSLKAELETWALALDAYDHQQFEKCLDLFETIADSAKILFNIGLVQATIGSHQLAVQNFQSAIKMDRYFSLAYFQSGVSHFLLGNYAAARKDFDGSYTRLRSNTTIDYEQIGLKFKLYSCEVLFNRGLSAIYSRDESTGLADLLMASKEKQTSDHDVIDEALADRGDGYTVFSIPVGLLYRPAASKMRNLKTKDYLGVAKLVAATDQRDAFVGFTGTGLQRASSDLGPRSPLPEQRVGLIRSKTTVARNRSDLLPSASTPLSSSFPFPSTSQAKSLPFAVDSIDPSSSSSLSSSNRRPGNSIRRRSRSTGAIDGLSNIAGQQVDDYRPPSSTSPSLRTIPPPSRKQQQQQQQAVDAYHYDGRPPPTPPDSSTKSRVINFSSTPTNHAAVARSPDVIDAYYKNEEEGLRYDLSFDSDLERLHLDDRLLPSPSGQAPERVAKWADTSRSAARPPQELSRSTSNATSTTSHSQSNYSSKQNPSLPHQSRHSPTQHYQPSYQHTLQQQVLLQSPQASMLRDIPQRPSFTSNAPANLMLGRNLTMQTAYSDDNVSPTGYLMQAVEMRKIRIKLRYRNEIRGMSIPATVDREDFFERVRMKFGVLSMSVKYKDADGSFISIVDDDDWETAIDEAKEASQGRAEGKLEIHVSDE